MAPMRQAASGNVVHYYRREGWAGAGVGFVGCGYDQEAVDPVEEA